MYIQCRKWLCFSARSVFIPNCNYVPFIVSAGVRAYRRIWGFCPHGVRGKVPVRGAADVFFQEKMYFCARE